jgi:hypothetical protein
MGGVVGSGVARLVGGIRGGLQVWLVGGGGGWGMAEHAGKQGQMPGRQTNGQTDRQTGRQPV